MNRERRSAGNPRPAFCSRTLYLSVLSIDFETRATVDLKQTGVYPYAQHKDTDIWCMAWAFDDEEPEIWAPQLEEGVRSPFPMLPARTYQHIAERGEIRAWNAQFERVIWNEIMVKRYGAPAIAMEQWVCSAAEAAAMALPRSLDQCASVLKTGAQKDQEGYSLMMRMTRPRKILADGTPIWWDVEDRKLRLFEYCKQDVRTERGIVKALRRLTPKEREIYLLDQRTNDHGVLIDVPLVLAAKDIVDEGTERANAALSAITGGEVSEVSNSGRLRSWLNANGVATDSVAKPAVAELLESDLAPEARLALQLRADAGRSSTAKLDSMLAVRCNDNRARGLLLYHAASTGRWGGRLIQPQNFPRPEIGDIESYIPMVLERRYDELALLASPIPVVVSMLRSMLRAQDGYDLIAADFSSIEACVLNWLAGQEHVVKAFQALFAGDKSKHPYKIMACAMGRAPSPDLIIKGSDDYQAGKAAELGCGYQMGAKKFVKAAWDVYQVRVTEDQAETAVKAYRNTHDKVVDFWWDTQRACIEATENPGALQHFGGLRNLRAVVAGAYLYIVLPSGRPLVYAAPKVVMEPPPWGGEDRPSLHYWGVDPFSKQWGELRTYGGHLVENIVQAVSRDLMAEGLLRVEKAGYPPLLSVHDEGVCEIPKDFGDLKEFERLMATPPEWAIGCPIAAEGWRGERFRK